MPLMASQQPALLAAEARQVSVDSHVYTIRASCLHAVSQSILNSLLAESRRYPSR